MCGTKNERRHAGEHCLWRSMLPETELTMPLFPLTRLPDGMS
jgi:hypothetical protein